MGRSRGQGQVCTRARMLAGGRVPWPRRVTWPRQPRSQPWPRRCLGRGKNAATGGRRQVARSSACRAAATQAPPNAAPTPRAVLHSPACCAAGTCPAPSAALACVLYCWYMPGPICCVTTLLRHLHLRLPGAGRSTALSRSMRSVAPVYRSRRVTSSSERTLSPLGVSGSPPPPPKPPKPPKNLFFGGGAGVARRRGELGAILRLCGPSQHAGLAVPRAPKQTGGRPPGQMRRRGQRRSLRENVSSSSSATAASVAHALQSLLSIPVINLPLLLVSEHLVGCGIVAGEP